MSNAVWFIYDPERHLYYDQSYDLRQRAKKIIIELFQQYLRYCPKSGTTVFSILGTIAEALFHFVRTE